MISWAAALPVNPADIDPSQHLTEDALFQSLLEKALDPARFLPVIDTCKLIEHDEAAHVIRREVVFKGNPTPALERITYTSPTIFTFEQLASPTDWNSPVVGTVLNIIGAGANNELILTFSFEVQPGGPMQIDESKPREELYNMARGAVKSTIEAARKGH